jgi:hypothetical protein
MSDIAVALSDSLSRSGLGNMTAALLLPDGLVANPALAFTLESNTGFYRAASRQIGVVINAVQFARFTETSFVAGNALSAGAKSILLNSASGSAGQYSLQSDGITRWIMGHTGGAGSTDVWELSNYDAAGALLDKPLRIGSDTLGFIAAARGIAADGQIRSTRGGVVAASSGLTTTAGLGYTTFIDWQSSNIGRIGVYSHDVTKWGVLTVNPGGDPAAGEGQVVIGAATALTSKRLQVNGGVSIADTQLIQTVTPFANGAAAASGTLTNAPIAGNPTKWIPIDDNGTTRYIPAW